MQFNLQHEFPPLFSPIKYEDRILATGSCFAENVGRLLGQHKFNISINPSGILFNPISISKNLQLYIDPKEFVAEENIFLHQGLYHSWMHHGVFSNPDRHALKESIQNSLEEAHQFLFNANYLLITWGSAFVYELKAGNKIVANCHKVPNTQFHKRLLSVEEIFSSYKKLINQLHSVNPELKIIWSVSPVKYVRDGLHENNLSKSVLFLALNQLLNEFPHQYYFPAFELVQDELRDYRYYAEDLAHPNTQAIQYVWEKFVSHCLDPNTLPALQKIGALNQAMLHRPLFPGTENYEKFRLGQVQKIKELQSQFPEMNFEKEMKFFS